jgi:molybdenum cofactor cytidylyltransferase
VTARPSQNGGALILGAGFSRRFGADKRRHRLADGTPMLLATLARYKEAFEQLALVIRVDDLELRADVETRFPELLIVETGQAQLGMGYSLAAGISAVDHWTWVCVGLADMPYLRTDSLAQLSQAYQQLSEGLSQQDGGKIILQPTFNDQPGHPVIFGAAYFEDMKSIHGDEGARSVIQQHVEHLHKLELDDPGLITDLDRPG